MLKKVYIVKAMVFPVVMYGCESGTIKKAEHQRIDAFKLWWATAPTRPPLSQTKLFLDTARNPQGRLRAEPPWEEHLLHLTFPVQPWSLHTRVWGPRGVLQPACYSEARGQRAQFFHLNFVPCSHATPLSAQTLNPGPAAGVPEWSEVQSELPSRGSWMIQGTVRAAQAVCNIAEGPLVTNHVTDICFYRHSFF